MSSPFLPPDRRHVRTGTTSPSDPSARPVAEISAARLTPPPRVRDEVAAAARTCARLREAGLTIRVAEPAPSAPASIELIGDGVVVRTLTLSEAAAMGSGVPTV